MTDSNAFDAVVSPPPVAQSDPHAELLSLTLTEQAKAIRSGQLSSRELTLACVQRIDALDGKETLNSFLLHRGEEVVAEAARLDDTFARGTVVGPLHGVPLGIKDALSTAGVRTTGGTAILRDWIPEHDATAVRLLKAAGALVLGKTNLHEGGLGITSNNPHYGAVRNPYDASRIPGGSSGGSGAAVAARLCPAAIGSDSGGSVRIPAALCGVVGLKPTLGRVSRGGMLGLSWSYDVLGPITRTVSDAATILRVLAAGPDERDPHAKHAPDGGILPDGPSLENSASSLGGLRIGIPGGYFATDNAPDVDRVLDGTYKRLTEAGVELVPVTVPGVESATPLGFLTLLPEFVVLIEASLAAAGITKDLAASLSELGPDLQDGLGKEVGPNATPVPAHEYAQALREAVPAIRRAFAAALEDVDALLTATTPAVAIPIEQSKQMLHNGRTVDAFDTFIRYTFCVSVAGLPAISIPGGTGAEGLPVGLQLVGKPWAEARLLEIAFGLERLTTR